MDWDELQVTLLDFVGRQVSVDFLAAGTPIPIAGFEGVLANVTEGQELGRPNDELWAVGIRVKALPDEERADAYAFVVRAWFQGATRRTFNGRDGLEINMGALNILVAVEE